MKIALTGDSILQRRLNSREDATLRPLFDLIRKLSYNGWCGAEYRDTGDGFDWMPAREI